MRKKKNWFLRGFFALLFAAAAVFSMLFMYQLSSESGSVSGIRSQEVTESLKEEANRLLESSPEGISLKEKIKYLVIRYSPYGDNWANNVRKLAHFSVYAAMAFCLYIPMWILGFRKGSRLILTLCFCFIFALADESHQGMVDGRAMSKMDVVIDMCGALASSLSLSLLSLFFSLLGSIFHEFK